MSTYVGYFDESGTHDGSTHVVVGGFVAEVDAWKALDVEWQRFISSSPFNLEYLHMTDFVARVDTYKTWSESERKQFMLGVTAIIHDHVSACVAATFPAVHHAAFKKIDRTIASAHALSAVACWKNIGTWADENGIEGRVASVFEEPSKSAKDRKAKHEILDFHSDIKRTKPDIARQYRLNGIGFTDKKSSQAVQTADFFAFETYKRMTQGVTNKKQI